MDGGFFVSEDVNQMSHASFALVYGLGRKKTAPGDGWNTQYVALSPHVRDGLETDTELFYRTNMSFAHSLWFPAEEDPFGPANGNSSGYGEWTQDSKGFQSVDFGLIRAAVQASSTYHTRRDMSELNPGYETAGVWAGSHLKGPVYASGPFLWAAKQLMHEWEFGLTRMNKLSPLAFFLQDGEGTWINRRLNDPGVVKAITSTYIPKVGNSEIDQLSLTDLLGTPTSGTGWLEQGLSQLVDADLIINEVTVDGDAADRVISRHEILEDVIESVWGSGFTLPTVTAGNASAGTAAASSATADSALDIPAAASTASADDAATPLDNGWAWTGSSSWGVLSWATPEITLPAVTDDITLATPTLQTVTALSAYIVDAPVFDAPTQVTVTDNVTAAIAAYSAQANLRYAEEEARLRASLFGARAVMSTQFDKAVALLSAKKQAEIAEHETAMRVKQTEMQLQADLEYKRQLLQRNERVAMMELEADRTNLDAHKQWIGHDIEAKLEHQKNLIAVSDRDATLTLEAERTNQASALALYEAELRRVIAEADMRLKGDSTKGDILTRIALNNSEQGTRVALNNSEQSTRVSLNNSDQGTRAALANADAETRVSLANAEATSRASLANAENQTRASITDAENDTKASIANAEMAIRFGEAKGSLLDAIYRAIIGTITVKVHGLSNPGAITGLLSTVIDNNLKSQAANRDYIIAYENARIGLATQVSSAICTTEELRWKSAIQNMMAIKEALSAVGAAPSGTEHHPSGFERWGQVVSGIGATAATVMNAVSIFK